MLLQAADILHSTFRPHEAGYQTALTEVIHCSRLSKMVVAIHDCYGQHIVYTGVWHRGDNCPPPIF